MESNNVNWTGVVNFVIDWVDTAIEVFGENSSSSNHQQVSSAPSSGSSYNPSYGGYSPYSQQSGLGGINLTTLLLIGAGIYLITKK